MRIYRPELVEQLLALVGHGPVAVATDLDGTIMPVATDPNGNRIHPDAHSALRRLASRGVPIGVFTGRDGADAEQLLSIASATVVGTNGAEWRSDSRSVLVPVYDAMATALSDRLGDIQRHALAFLAPTAVRYLPNNSIEAVSRDGTLVILRKGRTAKSPNGISHMYYLPAAMGIARRAGLIELLARSYAQHFAGRLGELVSFERGGDSASFTVLSAAPKWESLAVFVRNLASGDGARVRSFLYIGDSEPDIPSLRLMRVVRSLTRLYAVGASVRHRVDEDTAVVEAASFSCDSVASAASMLTLLAELVEVAATSPPLD